MPNIIDSLIVEIGLDPAKFKLGKKEIEADAKRVREILGKEGKEIEGQAGRTAASIGGIRKEVLGLFAAFTGLGVGAFATQLIRLDAQTGRTAKTIDMTTTALSTWEGTAQIAGAKTGEITSAFVSLTQALQTAALTGDASLGAKFRQLFNIDVLGPNGLKSAADLYLEIADRAQGMDPAKAATAMAILGVPQGVIPLLLQGRGEIEKMLTSVRELGAATDADAAAAVRLTSAWQRAWVAIQGAARLLYPAGTRAGSLVAALFGPEGRAAVKAFFTESPAEFEKKSVAFKKAIDASIAREGGEALPQVGQGESATSLPKGGAFKSNAEKEAFIRAEAIKRGIDPNVAMAVAKSEGFYSYRSTIPGETSFGSFQLHYGGDRYGPKPGLGDVFTKKTGLDARDPATEREQVKFALDEAARRGWADWHGWKGARFAGISGANATIAATGAGGGATTNTRTTTVNIGRIDVNAPNANDSEGIAKSIGPAIRRDLFTQQANEGAQ